MKALKVIGKIFAVLFCIVYFFIMSGLMTVSFAMNFVSGNFYADVLKNTDFKEIKLEDLGELGEELGSEHGDNLQDVLVSALTEGGVDEEVATSIIENDEIREVIGKFIGDYINYNVGGEVPQISRKDIETVLSNPEVISITGKPTNEDIDEIYNQLNEAIEEMVNMEVDHDNSSGNVENNTVNW